MSWRRSGAAWAGPVAIVALVLFALRDFAFANQLTNEHPDLLAFWLPRWSFLGDALARGDIPLWNPYEMVGYRFAADPQSGWLYALPSVLFTVLDPGIAMRAMLVLQPALAGLGLYWFLRIEKMGRPAATLGGLALGGAMVSSEVAIAMPFAGAVAWTTILVAAAAGFSRASRWSRRVGWFALGGFAWSQVASAHLSHGLAIATVLVMAFVVAQATRATWGRQLLFLATLPLLSVAVLVPRFQFLGVSSLGEGYEALADGGSAVLTGGGIWSGWVLAFGAAPGAYLGAACLLTVPLAVRARRRRRLVIPFGACLAGAMGLVALLDVSWFRSFLADMPYGDVLLHNGGRLRYVALLTLPVLGAAGLQGAIEDRSTWRAVLPWLAGGLLLWLALPIAMGGDSSRWTLLAAFALPAVAAVIVATRKPGWAPLVVGLLAMELVVSAVISGRVTGGPVLTGLEGYGSLAFQPLRAADVDLDEFLQEPAFVAEIGEERYMTWVPPYAMDERGYLEAQEPEHWPMLANTRGTLFGLRDALGYNPVQHPAYWTWIRERNPMPVYYNAAVLAEPDAEDLKILGVRYLIVPAEVRPPVDGEVVATSGGYDLLDAGKKQPDVERRDATTIVVTDPVEGQVVSEAYDPGWSARTPDDREVGVEIEGPVMSLAGVGGADRVVMTYVDPWVTWSLLVGAVIWLALIVLWIGLAIRERDAPVTPPPATPRRGAEARPR